MLGRLKALRRRNEVMEEIRRRNYKAATTIQSAARGFALRTQLNRNWAAIDLQALARGYIQRRKTYLTIKEPQLVETSRSGYPRGTPGHRRHWQRRLEQCEFLYSALRDEHLKFKTNNFDNFSDRSLLLHYFFPPGGGVPMRTMYKNLVETTLILSFTISINADANTDAVSCGPNPLNIPSGPSFATISFPTLYASVA